MDWIIEAAFNLIAGLFADGASRRLPPWGCAALIALPIILIVGLL
jgi:hypothetical protein